MANSSVDGLWQVELPLVSVCSLEEYRAHAAAVSSEFARRQALERSLADKEGILRVLGYCYVCKQTRRFKTWLAPEHGPRGTRTPNWREELLCPTCRLNNRRRASLQIFETGCSPSPSSAIYITEQRSPLYRMLRRKYANTTGSEFLGTGGLLAHAVWRRVRHENIAKLSFPDGSFDYVLCFEVLEHVFEYRRGLQECFRCLKPAGRLVLSVPFDLNSADNVVLAAETSSGTAFYVHPPEYHADPIRREGALCYYHFGWSLLDELKGLGFRKAEAILYWSRDLGYLGGEGVLLVASKAGPSGSIKTQEGGQFPALPPA